MQDVEQQPGYEEAAMPTENENTDIIQNSVAAKGKEKETYESSENCQNLQLTPGEINQFQGIADTNANDVKHRSTLSTKDFGL